VPGNTLPEPRGYQVNRTLITLQAIVTGGEAVRYFVGPTVIVWFTVIFANFRESMAKACGRAQAVGLRTARKDVTANKVAEIAGRENAGLPENLHRVGPI
jgi:high-affinity K+ transport system ATPase subunit B